MTETTSPRSRFGANVGYLLFGWPLRLITFILVVVSTALGAGTAILGFGLLILTGGLLMARSAAQLERRTQETLLGREPVPSAYLPAPQDAGLVSRVKHILKDPQSWYDVLWVAVSFFASILTWALSLVWLVLSTVAVLGPLNIWVLSRLGVHNGGLAHLLGLPFPDIINTIIYIAIGIPAALKAPAVMQSLANFQASVGELLLNQRARSNFQVSQLQESRAAAQRAESGALRRLERDIHDGPQQRLVRLNMDLARARKQMGQNPQRADAILGAAMDQTQETLAELRQLSRGIAPPVLVDRGLEAAIDETAARSSIPVTVYSSLPGQLPSHVEQAAYFVISESLVNANKHSGATLIDLVTAVQDGWLYVTITDDGTGGASTAKGHGLAGLEERLHSVDGELKVTSPVGGPTTIEAVIPCES